MNTTTKKVYEFLEERGIKTKKLDKNGLVVGWGFSGGKIKAVLWFDECWIHPQMHMEGRDFINVPAEKYDSA